MRNIIIAQQQLHLEQASDSLFGIPMQRLHTNKNTQNIIQQPPNDATIYD